MKHLRVRNGRVFLALFAVSCVLGAVSAGVVAPASVGAAITTAPSNVTGNYNAGAIDVSWDAAVSDTTGLNYTVTLLDSGGAQVAAPVNVGTLAHSFSPGTPGPFTATVSANDDDLTASPAVSSVAINTAPGAPTGPTASLSGATAASVAFVAPGSDGGSAVTGYTVTSSPGGLTGSAAASPVVVSGLAPGTDYTFAVTATNAVGSGPATAASNQVTTPPAATAPDAPTGATASLSGATAASVAFVAPANDGGSAVTGYTVTSSPGGLTGSAAASPVVVSGLAPGTDYTFAVTATNAVGSGPATAASNQVTTPPAATAPDAPTGATASLSGATAASVAFVAPANDGGSAVTGYTVTSSPGGLTGSAAASPVVVSGLAPGTDYTFAVTATNAVGSGPASAASNAITTPNSPAAPSGVTATLASATSAQVSFTPPAANGSTISSYEVIATPGGVSQIGTASPLIVDDLTPGVTYTFTVRATNSVGTSASSSASADLRIPTTPSQPLEVEATPVTAFGPMVTVSWTAPSDDGAAPLLHYEVSFAGQNATVEAPLTSVVFGDVTPGIHQAQVRAINEQDLTGPPGESTTPAEVRAFAPFNSEAAFVRQQYRDFLGRVAEPAGLGYWQTLTADDRSNVSQIIESFMKAPEFAPRRSVVRLYLAYFDRQPDLAGFDYWSERLASRTATIDTVSQDFASSEEFQQRYGSLNDAEFVALVYNNVLVRVPDQAGYEYWLGRMANGMSRGRVMAEFSESPEFVAATRPAVDVTVTYRGMLNRRYDQAGFRFWVARIAFDQNSLRTLIANFYNSPEYAGRVTP